jgi:hypothetical protein
VVGIGAASLAIPPDGGSIVSAARGVPCPAQAARMARLASNVKKTNTLKGRLWFITSLLHQKLIRPIYGWNFSAMRSRKVVFHPAYKTMRVLVWFQNRTY